MMKYAAGFLLFYVAFSWLGCKKDTTNFYPMAPSQGDTVTLIGRAGNERPDSAWRSVFLDFSKEVQTAVNRSSWDLGFYSGTDDVFRVIINHAAGAAAYELQKTNLDLVVDSDTLDLATNQTLLLEDDRTVALTQVDPVDQNREGYLAGTVIRPVSLNSAENRVYIIRRGKRTNVNVGRWIKAKFTRTSNGYVVTYGQMDNSNGLYNTVSVTKDAAYNFKYASFSSNASSYEPARTLWDISWGRTTYKATADGTVRAQSQPDFIQINFMAGVTAAEVNWTDSASSYKYFTAAQLDNVTFSDRRDAIGTRWRNLPNSTAGDLRIVPGRFFLVKDAIGNVYSVDFSGGGSRANPIVHYKLLVDAETDN